MATQIAYHRDATGRTLYAFPFNQALAAWDTYKVQLVETPEDSTNYQGVLDDAVDWLWRIFEGAAEPASLADALQFVIELRASAGGDATEEKQDQILAAIPRLSFPLND